MAKRIDLCMVFHDIVNVLMWDDKFAKEGVSSYLPVGIRVTEWLGRAFTLSRLKKHKNKSQFALSYFYKIKFPEIESELKKLQKHYQDHIELYYSKVENNPLKEIIKDIHNYPPIEVHSNIMPCSPVLMFVRVNMLCDEAHIQLRNLHRLGDLTHKEYAELRSELFRPLNRFRADMASKINEAGKLKRSIEATTSNNKKQ